MPRTPPWTAGEVLDVECLALSPEARAALPRDREQLAREFAPRPLADVPRGTLFHRWLKLRRAAPDGPGARLPGATLDRIFRVARFLAWALGLLLGASSAGGYLLYFGREPVNPFWFVLWLVGVPILISLGLLALARAWHDWSGPGAAARALIGWICRRLPGNARTAWQAWSGTFARQRDRHARLAILPLLGLTQRAACGFALGALLTLGLRVVFTDIAFGWQSSAGWKIETWHAAARAISAPWTWLFPGACPTLEQMRHSHFTYAAGVAALDPAAAQAWWPFLAGCLACWGVALRGAVILFIGWHERQALRHPDFSHSEANALQRALTGPLFTGEAAPAPPAPDGGGVRSAAPAPGRSWLVLAAENGRGPAPADAAAAAGQAVSAALGGTVAELLPVAVDDPGANAEALAAVGATAAPVAVLLPAARDPILAIKKTLAAIATASAGRDCVVLLRGDAGRLPLWRKFAAAHRLDLELIAVP